MGIVVTVIALRSVRPPLNGLSRAKAQAKEHK
jgi:hypothetical protein